jgi:hypothetical protein
MFGRVDEANQTRWNLPGTHRLAFGNLSHNGTLVFDEAGRRINPREKPPVPDTRPVALVLGGSLSMGWPYNVSYADFLDNYRVINCSAPFENLATLAYFSEHQCADVKNPDLVILQQDIISVPDETNDWAVGLLFGESFIEDPYLFFDRQLSKNIVKYRSELRHRETGVPYLRFTDEEMKQLAAILSPSPLYLRSAFYRYVVNLGTSWRVGLRRKTNNKRSSRIMKLLAQVQPGLPDDHIAIRLLEQFRQHYGGKTKIVLLLLPDANGMLTSRHPEHFEPYLQQHLPSFEKSTKKWMKKVGMTEAQYLGGMRERFLQFEQTAKAKGFIVIPFRETLEPMDPDQIFYWDAHHYQPKIQEQVASVIKSSLLR